MAGIRGIGDINKCLKPQPNHKVKVATDCSPFQLRASQYCISVVTPKQEERFN